MFASAERGTRATALGYIGVDPTLRLLRRARRGAVVTVVVVEVRLAELRQRRSEGEAPSANAASDTNAPGRGRRRGARSEVAGELIGDDLCADECVEPGWRGCRRVRRPNGITRSSTVVELEQAWSRRRALRISASSRSSVQTGVRAGRRACASRSVACRSPETTGQPAPQHRRALARKGRADDLVLRRRNVALISLRAYARADDLLRVRQTCADTALTRRRYASIRTGPSQGPNAPS